MKKYILFPLICGVILFSSCEKGLYDTPEGELNISATTVKVGEPVTFEWNGNGDHIVFYSGELKHEYKYKDRKVLKGVPEVYFEYRNYKGDLTWSRGNLELYCSTDYTGENFETATWNNVTERFNIGEGKNSYQKTGYISFEDLQGTNATFAFRAYSNVGKQVDIGWGNFKIRSYSPEIDSYVDVLSVAKDAPGIITVNKDEFYHKWELNTNWRFRQSAGKNPTVVEEGWCILPTQSFQDTVYPGDEGEVKKTLNADNLPWTHTYSKAGKYSITVIVSCYDSSSGVSNEKVVTNEIEVVEATE